MEINYDAKNPTKIKVFGVGGGGSNAVARMYQEGLQDVELYIVNTDLQHLNFLPVPNKIHIGESISKGLGAGSKPEIGREAALENLDKIKEALEGADMVFIAAGLGGGTGTGASPVIAQAAKEMGILTVAVVTKPFSFEGKVRQKIAEEGLAELREKVDTYLVIHNDRLLQVAGKNVSFAQAFKLVDSILYKSVKGITDLILVPALVNPDFADVKTVMENAGKALIGVGSAKGDNKIEDAVMSATTSPLLEGTSIQGARRLLINVEVSPDLSFQEVNEAVSQIRELAHEEAHIIFGAAIMNDTEDEIKITVIATDFESEAKKEVKHVQSKLKKSIVEKKPFDEKKEEIIKSDVKSDELSFDDLEIPPWIRKGRGS
ncbi:cell division protein FtsZ [Sulfurihydrogenibium azorense]|uniref:cell division protein FtsZ n=1 Tax=Sulfurihydrogenibium azorense TaxID=309806 RepID=UPI00391C0BFC